MEEDLRKLNSILKLFGRGISPRTEKEGEKFIEIFGSLQQQEGQQQEQFDAFMLSKVLPKLHGGRFEIEDLLYRLIYFCLKKEKQTEDPRKKISSYFEKRLDKFPQEFESKKDDFRFPRSAKKLLWMLKTLISTGFASFF